MARKEETKKRQWNEFECPECSANNPYENGFTFGDEIFCSWCGQVFIVRKVDDGERYRLVLH